MPQDFYRLPELWSRKNEPGLWPVGKTKANEDFLLRDPADPFVPGTDVRRAKITSLGPKTQVITAEEAERLPRELAEFYATRNASSASRPRSATRFAPSIVGGHGARELCEMALDHSCQVHPSSLRGISGPISGSAPTPTITTTPTRFWKPSHKCINLLSDSLRPDETMTTRGVEETNWPLARKGETANEDRNGGELGGDAEIHPGGEGRRHPVSK